MIQVLLDNIDFYRGPPVFRKPPPLKRSLILRKGEPRYNNLAFDRFAADHKVQDLILYLSLKTFGRRAGYCHR